MSTLACVAHIIDCITTVEQEFGKSLDSQTYITITNADNWQVSSKHTIEDISNDQYTFELPPDTEYIYTLHNPLADAYVCEHADGQFSILSLTI